MGIHNHPMTVLTTISGSLALGVALLLTSCTGKALSSQTDLDLEPFKERARIASCADLRNQLFLIDGSMVFLNAEGSCMDASYHRALFGQTPDDVLCSLSDTIAGPREVNNDDQACKLFKTMIDHPDQPDLGLGADHQVEPIPF